jgi:hypothetical protein
VFENWVLRLIFGLKKDEVTGGAGEKSALGGVLWNSLFNRIYSVHQIIKNEMGGICSTCGRQNRCKYGFGGDKLLKVITWKL